MLKYLKSENFPLSKWLQMWLIDISSVICYVKHCIEANRHSERKMLRQTLYIQANRHFERNMLCEMLYRG